MKLAQNHICRTRCYNYCRRNIVTLDRIYFTVLGIIGILLPTIFTVGITVKGLIVLYVRNLSCSKFSIFFIVIYIYVGVYKQIVSKKQSKDWEGRRNKVSHVTEGKIFLLAVSERLTYTRRRTHTHKHSYKTTIFPLGMLYIFLYVRHFWKFSC